MKLVSLNIEGKEHWDRVNPFFATEGADVICLQEIFEADAKSFAERFSMEYVFVPMFLTVALDEGQSDLVYEKKGIAVFSKHPLSNIHLETYHSEMNELQLVDKSTLALHRKTQHNVLILADVKYEDSMFTVGTTHFAWTPDGAVRDYQEEDATALLKILAGVPDVILCGDFNAPRGFNKVYDLFATHYKDVIPKSYASSLDPLLHRAFKDPSRIDAVSCFMVDYLFLSEKYIARDVRLQFGLSDHGGVIATITLV
jgi:endonuclease/exonuclease/phosphatase family metal-dependent hydrolase